MASTSTNMALIKWNLGSDQFSYPDLSANWDKVDAHDHTTGKGVQVPSAGIADGAITSTKLGTNSVTSAAINANAVIDTKIATSAVTSAKIADAAVSEAKLSTALAGFLGVTSGGINRRGYDEILTAQSTTSGSYADLATVGPSVTLTVPANALVLMQGSVDIATATTNLGQVMVAEDGLSLGVSTIVAATSNGLTAIPNLSFSGQSVQGTTTAATKNAICFPTTAGTHTYKFIYRSSTIGQSATFSNRRLWAWVLSF